MKNQIPEFLQEKLLLNKPKVKNFPNDIKQFIIDYGEFYDFGYNDDVTRIFKLMKQGISEIPECELDCCNNKKMIKKFEAELSKGCCSQHAQEITMLERFGISNLFKDPTIAKKGMLNKYGVSHNMKIQEVKNKIKVTMVTKYGVENPSQADEIKEKKKNTLLKNHNVTHNSQINEVKESKKKKSLEKYGVEFILQSDEVREKIKQTNLEKYGVEHHLQNPEIYSKTKKTNLSKYGLEFPVMRVSSYTHKEYKWKTGEISMVQGHEPIVLSELEEKGYTYNDIETDTASMPEIFYEFEGKRRRYYPDIFIPKENLIIEVKSDYTLNKEWARNQAKFDATKNLGFNFKLEVR